MLSKKIKRMKKNFWEIGMASAPKRIAVDTEITASTIAIAAYLDCGEPMNGDNNVISNMLIYKNNSSSIFYDDPPGTHP